MTKKADKERKYRDTMQSLFAGIDPPDDFTSTVTGELPNCGVPVLCIDKHSNTFTGVLVKGLSSDAGLYWVEEKKDGKRCRLLNSDCTPIGWRHAVPSLPEGSPF